MSLLFIGLIVLASIVARVLAGKSRATTTDLQNERRRMLEMREVSTDDADSDESEDEDSNDDESEDGESEDERSRDEDSRHERAERFAAERVPPRVALDDTDTDESPAASASFGALPPLPPLDARAPDAALPPLAAKAPLDPIEVRRTSHAR